MYKKLEEMARMHFILSIIAEALDYKDDGDIKYD